MYRNIWFDTFINRNKALYTGVDHLEWDAWFVDSTCGYHLCKDRESITNFQPIVDELIVGTMQDKLTTSGVGEFLLVTSKGVKTLKKVYYVPELKLNILSLSALAADGFTITFGNGGVSLYENNINETPLLYGKSVNDVFVLNCSKPVAAEAECVR